MAEDSTAGILDPENYVQFWISFRAGEISVGKVGSSAFLWYNAGQMADIRFVFFRSGLHKPEYVYYWILFKFWYFSEAKGTVNAVQF